MQLVSETAYDYDPKKPESKKCDFDKIAEYIVKKGYTPKTSLANLVVIILLSFDCCDNYGGEYGNEFSTDKCLQYVEDSGGIAEFDYYC